MKNSEIQDILTPVFEGGLKTHEDKYLSILSNDLIMYSISLVKSREIARCYSDIHRESKIPKNPLTGSEIRLFGYQNITQRCILRCIQSTFSWVPKMFSEVEVRSLENISIFDICHIEVPFEEVEEVRDILRRKKLTHISVFPIKIGEKILFELLRR